MTAPPTQGLRLLATAALALALLLAGASVLAVDSGEDEKSSALDPDFAAGKQAIASKQWPAAIKALSSAALRDTRNADIENELGYAYRQLGQMEHAFAHYDKALKLNPRHRGAHEYAGEAALLAGDLPQAEQHLKALQEICVLPCEELDELKEQIERYRKQGGK
jgi:Flp pilus assembly protein TadD